MTGLGGMAAAQQSQDWTWCENKGNSFPADVRIRGCTALIQSGQEKGHRLAMAYAYRGMGHDSKSDLYTVKSELYRAIADFSDAVRVDPTLELAYRVRGFAYLYDHQFPRGVADFSELIRLDPNDWSSYASRGEANFLAGNYSAATTDFARAIQLTGESWQAEMPAVWGYIARKRAGTQNAETELQTNAAKFKKSDSIYAAIELFLGLRTPEATLATGSQLARRCDLPFYAGHWYLLHSQQAMAMRMLQAAVEGCPKNSDIFLGAHVELERLRH